MIQRTESRTLASLQLLIEKAKQSEFGALKRESKGEKIMGTPQKPDSPPGQQKMHTIKNTNTGETKEITQEEWRTNGAALKAEGWVRVDEPETPTS